MPAVGKPLLVLQHIACEPPAATDPVFSVLPAQFAALQWHGDTYQLPEGAVQLAHSEAYEQQAFRFQRAYGLQFHLEVDAALASDWGEVPAYAQSLRELLGDDGLSGLVEEVHRHEAETIALARRVFAAWLEHAVGLMPPLKARPPSPAAYEMPRATHRRWSCSIASPVLVGSASRAAAAARRSRMVTARASSAKRPSQRTAARS
jgi:hypothetical protein